MIEYETRAEPNQETLLLSKDLPVVPDAVIKRFPDMQEYNDGFTNWWKKNRRILMDAHQDYTAPLNEITKNVESLSVQSGDFSAAINIEKIARITADGALASLITSVQADYMTADAAISASVTTEITARVTADAALATSITTVITSYTTADAAINAAILSESTARSSADGALSSSISSVIASYTAADATISASVTTEATARAGADGAIHAKWGVAIDVNGRIVGRINLDGTNQSSTFKISVDKLVVENAIGTLTLLDLNSTGIVFGTDILSNNFAVGVNGWRIERNTGNVEFNSGVFRGTLSAATIIGGTLSIPDSGMVNLGYSTFQNLGANEGIGLELGYYRTAAERTWIDFHTIDTPGDDFEARIIRNGDVDGDFLFQQTGAGNLVLQHDGTGDIVFNPSGGHYVQLAPYTAVAPAATGYLSVKDSGGTVRKLLCA